MDNSVNHTDYSLCYQRRTCKFSNVCRSFLCMNYHQQQLTYPFVDFQSMTPTIPCVIDAVHVFSDFCRSFLCMNDPTNERPASVGLAQARPNKYMYCYLCIMYNMCTSPH